MFKYYRQNIANKSVRYEKLSDEQILDNILGTFKFRNIFAKCIDDNHTDTFETNEGENIDKSIKIKEEEINGEQCVVVEKVFNLETDNLILVERNEQKSTTKQTIKIQKRNLMVDFFTNNIIEDKKNILDETVLYNFFCDWLKDKTQDVPNKKSFNAFLKSIVYGDNGIKYSIKPDNKTKKRSYHGIKIK